MSIVISHIALTLISFCTSFISATLGMAGGLILLTMMIFFMPLEVAIPIHGLVQLLSNGFRVFFLRHSVVKKFFIPFLFGAPIGTYLGTQVIQAIDKRLPLFLLGVLILYQLFKPKKLPKIKVPPRMFFVVGIFSGLLGVLIGATGPFLALFFVGLDIKKEQIVATKALLQSYVHILKIPAFLYLGIQYQEHIYLVAFMVVAAFLGTRMGVNYLKKMNEALFFKLFKTILFIAALRAFAKAFELF